MYEWPLSVAIRESEWLFPVLQTFHILGLVLLVGVIAIVDLRLLRAILRDESPGFLARRLLPITHVGFAVTLASGVLLLAAQGAALYFNVFLRVKLLLLGAALLNILLFHATVFRSASVWDFTAPIPRAASAFAAISLAFWTGVVLTGRYIAYF